MNLQDIISMEDENGNDGIRILNATFADPYLLILKEDSSLKLYKAIGADELEDVEASDLSSTQWLSASLFRSSTFDEIYAFLLTHEGGLHVRIIPMRYQTNTKSIGL